MAHRKGFIAVALALATLTAACSSSGPNKRSSSPADPTPASPTSISTSASPPSSPSSSSSSVATAASIESALEAAWLNYWKVSLALTTYPRSEWPTRVKAIALEPIYGELLNSVRVQQDKLGQVGYGYVTSHPYWLETPTGSMKTVVMGDCFDGSHAGTKLATTGKVKTVGKTHTNIRATLVKGGDGRWRVHQIEYLKASC